MVRSLLKSGLITPIEKDGSLALFEGEDNSDGKGTWVRDDRDAEFEGGVLALGVEEGTVEGVWEAPVRTEGEGAGQRLEPRRDTIFFFAIDFCCCWHNEGRTSLQDVPDVWGSLGTDEGNENDVVAGVGALNGMNPTAVRRGASDGDRVRINHQERRCADHLPFSPT